MGIYFTAKDQIGGKNLHKESCVESRSGLDTKGILRPKWGATDSTHPLFAQHLQREGDNVAERDKEEEKIHKEKLSIIVKEGVYWTYSILV